MTTLRPGALLMTYGSPASVQRDDVAAYLGRVRGGRRPEPGLVDEFTRRYQVIGGSPLIDVTRRQAMALSAALGWPVEIGMRFSEPSIARGYETLARAGVGKIVGIVLSPQYSPMLMGGYGAAVQSARGSLGGVPDAVVADAWHSEPAFIAALAKRLRGAIEDLPDRLTAHVLLTAHSLPKKVADREPAYLDQLRETAENVAAAAGLLPGQWSFCWQSAGHEPGEWMKPDFADLLPEIAASGGRTVVVVPVQFLGDHLEVLYDVDVGAREQAERLGLDFRRVPSLNEDPDLMQALASVARRTLGLETGAVVERPLRPASPP
jgi:protoporphyrin/coproporphyrin ferrochelatase